MTVKNKNIDTLISETNTLVHELNIWFKRNKLKLNASKTNLIGFSTKNCNIKFFKFRNYM